MDDSSASVTRSSKPHYLTLIVRMFALSLLALLGTRLVMLVFYHDYFATSAWSDVLIALVYGVRFDVAALTIIGSLVWLVLIIPIQWVQHPKVRQVLSCVFGVLLWVLLSLCLGDVYYFGEVDRHMGRELLNMGVNDIGALVGIAVFGAPLFTAISFVLLLLLSWIWWRWVVRFADVAPYVPQKVLSKVVSLVLVLLLLVFLGRGMLLKSRPIAVIDAYVMPSQPMANLALNGVFVLMKEASRPDQKPLNLLTNEQFDRMNSAFASQQTSQGQGVDNTHTAVANTLFSWQKDQFKQHIKQPPAKAKNVVVILLESWGYRYIDALANNGYGATPFMDSLVAKSQVWDRAYAAGQRSIYGLQATLSSIAVLDNYPSLGFGLESSRMSQIGHLAREQGYGTFFVQTSARRSFHVDGIANRLGFEHYYGKEDIPIIKDYPQEPPSFGWDYDGLMFLHKQLDDHNQTTSGQPFLAMLFTGTTHLSYADPGEAFHIRPHSSKSENGFLNTLRYSDWSLQQFMAAAKQSPWYQDTVFIFLADHMNSAVSTDLEDQFHIPLVVFAPDGSLAPKRHAQVVSQYDIMPTLMDLMQLPHTIATFGRSLFDDPKARPPYALVSKGSLYGVIHEHGWATFSEQKNVEMQTSKRFEQKDADRLRDHARWRMQHTDKALRDNRWLPTD